MTMKAVRPIFRANNLTEGETMIIADSLVDKEGRINLKQSQLVIQDKGALGAWRA